MFKNFISLEWKSFSRSASFNTNLVLKILMGLGALYFIGIFTFLGVGLYYFLEKMELEPFAAVNRFLVFYLLLDLLIRFFLQKTPVMNIRSFLILNVSKKSIVGYSLGKTLLSFFNWVHLFLFLPFSVVLLREGFDLSGVIAWFIGIYSLLFLNNFLNILSNNNNWLLYSLVGILVGMGSLHYYGIFEIGDYASVFFNRIYENPINVIIPIVASLSISVLTFNFFKRNLYLDAGLAVRQKEVISEELTWLDQFGTLGSFLKNDIKLIKRNKRSRTTVIMSLLFIFYGLLFFSGGIEVYEGPVWKVFAGLFVTGGFLFTFGQFVPSWDSAYYPLMMSQNIRYRDYLNSKWWLIVFATFATTILSSFYLYFGWEAYLAVLVGGIYNVGVNAHVVLWGGAYIKTPIDLSKNKNVFGDKQAFNMKTLLLTVPKILLPMLLYAIGHYTSGPMAGYAIVAFCGVAGFAFKKKVFKIIENIYRTEKYKTLAAYKQHP